MSDTDTGRITRGHVCEHGIHWPHPCDECDAVAWERRTKLTELLKDGLWLTGRDEYVAQGYGPSDLLFDGNFSMAALAENLIAKGGTVMFESPPCKLIADRPK